MCGIAGTAAPYRLANEARIRRSVHRLEHRGPDGSGVLRTDLGWCVATVGMTRLAIVDPAGLTVPFQYEYLGVVLAFNGEVYNWKDIRRELSDGVPWQSNCDAEVVARAWRRWGPECLAHFNGMFALAIVDQTQHKIMLARDRAGEKPLYYVCLGGSLHFASEAKALPIELVEGPCSDAEVLEFDCLEQTPFRGVYCLGPGERMVLACAEDLTAPKIERWWSLPEAGDVDYSLGYDACVGRLEELLTDAVRLRVTYDVPAVVQLSGGLDSAVLQALVKSSKVYTLTFPYDGFDNVALSEEAACGATVVPVTFQLEEALAFLGAVAFHLDTPATWSALGHWFLCRHMRAGGARVVLTGEGADELLAGYTRYRALWWLERARQDNKLADYGAVVSLAVGGSNRDILARLIDRSAGGAGRERVGAMIDRFAPGLRSGEADLVAAACRVEFYTTMQCLLRMADRMSAAHALENRSPFFDYRVMDLCARMPTSYKITERWSKAPLRDLARKLGVPDSIVGEITKRGMVVPWNSWRGATSGPRGKWDRSDFNGAMWAAWRSVFFDSGSRVRGYLHGAS